MTGPTLPTDSALDSLREYLSGSRSPHLVADSLTRLEADVGAVADVIVAWAGAQAAAESRPDYQSLALRRILALGTLGTIAQDRLTRFVRAVAGAVLFRAPAEGRERLASLLGPLASVETGGASEGVASPSGSRPAVTPRTGPPSTSPRLTLLLDRLDVIRTGGDKTRSPRELVAETVVTASLQARSAADFEAALEDLLRRGVIRGTADVLHALVETLPSYWLPSASMATPPAALLALERLCALAGSRQEGARRFREMVEVAVEEFNRGALGRAGRVFELAERILDAGEVDAQLVEPLRQSGHERLNLDRVRRLVESKDRQALSPAVLRFFRVFAPEAVIEKMRREPRHERRRLLLLFLETHGEEGRRAALEHLGRPEHEHDFFLLRNLVHLLRVIPQPKGAAVEPELARVARLLVPEHPPYLVNEVLAYLGDARHPVAEQVLGVFFRSLEEALLAPSHDTWEEDRKRYRSYLDRTAAVLALQQTPAAWAAVVEHGLRRDEALGRAEARLADLAACDLGKAPALAARLVAAAQAELPKGVLAELGPGAQARLIAFVTALSGTRTQEAKELLQALAARFTNQELGELASRTLARQSVGTTLAPEGQVVPDASLSGDLQMFALPTLLQSLADMSASGDLALTDEKGRRRATVTVAAGHVTAARFGPLTGPEAVFELLEHPFPGTFAFQRQAAPSGVPTHSVGVTELILEGLRRQDELRRASLLVPDEARLEVTGQAPTAIPGEHDIDFVTALWEKVVSGAGPQECERAFSVDAYRIRRGLAHWLEVGALRLH